MRERVKSTYSSHLTEIDNFDIDNEKVIIHKPVVVSDFLKKFKRINRVLILVVFAIVAVVLMIRRKMPKRVPLRLI